MLVPLTIKPVKVYYNKQLLGPCRGLEYTSRPKEFHIGTSPIGTIHPIKLGLKISIIVSNKKKQRLLQFLEALKAPIDLTLKGIQKGVDLGVRGKLIDVIKEAKYTYTLILDVD